MALRWHSRDERLVEDVRRGKPRAFEQIYARHQPAILSFCRHLTGHREDAEDAVQHTFLSAYCQIAESEGALELRPWLFTVARNRCLSLLRARRSRETVALGDADRATDGLALEVEHRQELRELVRDLSRLPEQQRAALLLAQLDDMSHREIGLVLGVAPAKVKALVFQARSSLASTREARAASCSDIRSQLAGAHGPALRQRKLRRHLHECDGCRTFESIVLGQRRDLTVLLPAVPSLGLREAILGAIPVGGGAAGGSLIALGGQGAAKLVVVGIVAAGGTGAIASDPPTRIEQRSPVTDSASVRPAPVPHMTLGRGAAARTEAPAAIGRLSRPGAPEARWAPSGRLDLALSSPERQERQERPSGAGGSLQVEGVDPSTTPEPDRPASDSPPPTRGEERKALPPPTVMDDRPPPASPAPPEPPAATEPAASAGSLPPQAVGESARPEPASPQRPQPAPASQPRRQPARASDQRPQQERPQQERPQQAPAADRQAPAGSPQNGPEGSSHARPRGRGDGGGDGGKPH